MFYSLVPLWVPHSFCLVPHLIKTLRELLLASTTCKNVVLSDDHKYMKLFDVMSKAEVSLFYKQVYFFDQ